MSSQAVGKVKVLTEDEFWSEIRQFKIRQLMRWHEELRRRRLRMEGLQMVQDEFSQRLVEIQAIQETELAELMTEQIIDNSSRIEIIEQRLLGVVVWLMILIGLQLLLFWRLGVSLF